MIKSIRNKIAAKFSKSSERQKSLGLFFATSLFTRGATIASQVVQVPLILHAFGNEGFGLWITVTGIQQLLTFTDFGVGTSAQNQMAEAFAHKDSERARQLFASGLVTLCGLGLLIAAVLLPVAYLIDVASLFNITQENLRQSATGALAASIVGFCAGFPMAMAHRLAFSRQLGWKLNLRVAWGRVFTLAAIFIGVHLHWTLGQVILATFATQFLTDVMFLNGMLKELGWLNWGIFRAHKTHVRGLLKIGAYFGVQQIANTVLFALPPIVISTTIGAAAVTPFNLAQRLFGLFSIVQNAFMTPLWPAFSEANAKGEIDWIRRTLRKALLGTIFATVLPMAIGAAFAPQILTLWVGSTADLPNWTLILLLFTWNALTYLQQPFGYLLAGVSAVRRTTFYGVCTAVVCVVLMFALVKPFHAPGVVIGMIAGFLPFNFIGNVIETKRFLRSASAAKRPSGSVESINPSVI